MPDIFSTGRDPRLRLLLPRGETDEKLVGAACGLQERPLPRCQLTVTPLTVRVYGK